MNKSWSALVFTPLITAAMTGCPSSPPNPSITTVTVTPASSTTFTGGTRTFTAVARDAAGNVVTATFTWASSDTSVATVDVSTGIARGVKPGSTTITATAGGVSGTASLNVSAGLVAGN
jgi:uncharacterized protein YjdB